jgi:hypothetical protein
MVGALPWLAGVVVRLQTVREVLSCRLPLVVVQHPLSTPSQESQVCAAKLKSQRHGSRSTYPICSNHAHAKHTCRSCLNGLDDGLAKPTPCDALGTLKLERAFFHCDETSLSSLFGTNKPCRPGQRPSLRQPLRNLSGALGVSVLVRQTCSIRCLGSQGFQKPLPSGLAPEMRRTARDTT